MDNFQHPICPSLFFNFMCYMPLVVIGFLCLYITLLFHHLITSNSACIPHTSLLLPQQSFQFSLFINRWGTSVIDAFKGRGFRNALEWNGMEWMYTSFFFLRVTVNLGHGSIFSATYEDHFDFITPLFISFTQQPSTCN